MASTYNLDGRFPGAPKWMRLWRNGPGWWRRGEGIEYRQQKPIHPSLRVGPRLWILLPGTEHC